MFVQVSMASYSLGFRTAALFIFLVMCAVKLFLYYFRIHGCFKDSKWLNKACESWRAQTVFQFFNSSCFCKETWLLIYLDSSFLFSCFLVISCWVVCLVFMNHMFRFFKWQHQFKFENIFLFFLWPVYLLSSLCALFHLILMCNSDPQLKIAGLLIFLIYYYYWVHSLLEFMSVVWIMRCILQWLMWACEASCIQLLMFVSNPNVACFLNFFPLLSFVTQVAT